MRTSKFQMHVHAVSWSMMKYEKLVNISRWSDFGLFPVRVKCEKLVKNIIQNSNYQTDRFWTSQLLLKSAKVFYRWWHLGEPHTLHENLKYAKYFIFRKSLDNIAISLFVDALVEFDK